MAHGTDTRKTDRQNTIWEQDDEQEHNKNRTHTKEIQNRKTDRQSGTNRQTIT